MKETISKSDLISLFDVVEAATGLYNALERFGHTEELTAEVGMEFDNLGMKLRVLGLAEVKP